MDKRVELGIGLEEIHGEHHGENKVFLESGEEGITLVLRKDALEVTLAFDHIFFSSFDN